MFALVCPKKFGDCQMLFEYYIAEKNMLSFLCDLLFVMRKLMLCVDTLYKIMNLII